MISRTTIFARAAALGLAALVAGCGGGDNGLAPSSSSASFYAGTMAGNRDAAGVVLPDGRYYLVYSAPADANTVGGALQGTSSVTGEAFASTDTIDFAVAAAGAAQKAATVSGVLTAVAFSGTETPAGGTAVAFQTAGFYATAPASLGALAGAYTGTAGFALGVRPAVFTVAADGSVTSSINGCAITGTAAPRTDSDTYDLTITFGGPPCAITNVSFTGIAFQRPDTGRLYAVARNNTLKQSVIFTGTK
jgi:hypothetical protein